MHITPESASAVFSVRGRDGPATAETDFGADRLLLKGRGREEGTCDADGVAASPCHVFEEDALLICYWSRVHFNIVKTGCVCTVECLPSVSVTLWLSHSFALTKTISVLPTRSGSMASKVQQRKLNPSALKTPSSLQATFASSASVAE